MAAPVPGFLSMKRGGSLLCVAVGVKRSTSETLLVDQSITLCIKMHIAQIHNMLFVFHIQDRSEILSLNTELPQYWKHTLDRLKKRSQNRPQMHLVLVWLIKALG